MNRPARQQGRLPPRTLVAGAFAVVVAGLGTGMILPLLPVMIGQLIAAPGPSDIAWHTSLLTGAFTIAPLITARPWGLLSDRYGRRPILIVGMLGFSITLGATAFPSTLAALYVMRLLNGAFAAAILPTVLALVTDLERDESRRARVFALVNAAFTIGLLAGPMAGGLASDLPSLPMPPGAPSSWWMVTFLGAAVLALAAALGIAFAVPSGTVPGAPAADRTSGRLNRAVQMSLVLLAALAAAGLGLFEVVLTLRSLALAMSPSVLGLFFAGCMVAMLLVQALAFSPLARPAVTQWFISPAFLLLGIGLVVIPWSAGGSELALATAGIAAASGFLAPALAYWLSYGSGRRAGAELGLQTAAVSVGQTLGAAAAVWLVGNSVTGGALLIGLTIGAVAAGLALSIYLGRSGAAEAPSMNSWQAINRRQE